MVVNSFPPVPRMNHIVYEYDSYLFVFLTAKSVVNAAVWFYTRSALDYYPDS